MILLSRSVSSQALGTTSFMTYPFRKLLLFCSLACFICGQALGGNPSLELITPPVGTRGDAFTVVAKGASLKDIRSVVFYEPGVRCERIEATKDEEARLHMVADARCSLGPHAFRLLGDNGFSELRTLTISPFPTVQEDKDAEEQLVAPNRTVLGTLESDDVDSFQIRAKAGERISAEAVGVRLGISLLDTTLTLRDPFGHVLKRVDDTPMLNQDPSFSVLAPVDGMYTIEITSAGANADADSQYALHIGNFPRPYSVFPLGVKAGTETDITFTSSDIEQADSFRKRMSFDSGLIGTRFIELKEGDKICPSPIPFRVSTYDQFCDEAALSQTFVGSGVVPVLTETAKYSLTVPVAVHGVVREVGEIDKFRFRAHQDSTVSLEVFASRLGSLLDAVVEVRDQNDRVVISGDDFDSHDTRLVFETKADDTYVVSIRDKRKNSGAAYSYCVEVAPLHTSITTFLPRRNKLSQAGQTIAIPKGNRTLAFLGLHRDRLNGEASLMFEGLLNGVIVDCPRVADSAFVVPAVFTADASSPLSGSLVQVNASLQPVGSKTTKVTGGFEQIVDLVNGPADAIYQLTRVDRLAVATVDTVPYSIELVRPTLPLSADGTLDITIEVKREPGFDAPIDITLPLLPDWVDCQAKTRIPANKASGTITLRANRAAKAGDWPLVAEGVAGLVESSPETGTNANATGMGMGMGMRSRRRVTVSLTNVCTSLHSLTVCDSPAHGTIDSVSAERGSSVELVCRLDLRDSIPENLVATLEDLPNRVHVESIQVKRTDNLVKFHLNIEDDAPIGTVDSVVCRLSGTLDNQHVSYCVARNTKLIIAAPGASQKDESGRPLSRLEALRLRKNKQGS